MNQTQENAASGCRRVTNKRVRAKHKISKSSDGEINAACLAEQRKNGRRRRLQYDLSGNPAVKKSVMFLERGRE